MKTNTNDNDSESTTTVTIDKLVYGGDGLGRIDGQVILVPLVLPGESVQVQAKRVKKGLLRGLEAQVLQAVPDRVPAPCEYFGSCGGCQYQHFGYELQLAQKREILRETLRRTGGIVDPGEIRIISGEPWGYRNRIQLHFSQRHMGFHKLASHDLCDIDHCPISSPMLNQVIRTFRDASKRTEWPLFLNSLEVFTNETNVQLNVLESDRPVAARFFEWCGEMLPQLVPGSLQYKTASNEFRISGGSFFQVNRFLVDALVEEVTRDLSGHTAIDLYSGAGLFSLPLAKRFSSVTSVERSIAAARDLEANAKAASVDVVVEKSSAGEFLRGVQKKPDLIIADPPRAGLGKESVTELLRLAAEQIIIISCDPTTLARDLKTLLGQYAIESLAMVDLFPQTYHLETVAKLRLR